MRLVPIVTLICIGLWSCQRAGAANYVVSPYGDDTNAGTFTEPWKTLAHARDYLRVTKGEMTSDITVFLRGGYHLLGGPLLFDDRDSGNNGYRILYRAAEGERPVVSGGRRITGWTPGPDGIWSAEFDFEDKIRDLWVDGGRRKMAQNSFSHDAKIPGQGPWGSYDGTPTGIRFRKSDIGPLTHPQDVEIMMNSRWTYHILSVAAITEESSHPDQWVFRMQEPYFHIAQSTLLPPHAPHATREYWIANAKELLDEPGEFYFDRQAKRMYYMPFPGENLHEAEVIAPVARGLLRIEGRSMAEKVRDVVFAGITFQHDAWLLDEIDGSRGASSNQGPKLIRYAGTATEAEGDALLQAAIELYAAQDVHFYRNVFEHLGGAAINLINGVSDCVLEGNIFRDLGAHAIAVAHPDLRNTEVLTQFAEEEWCMNNVIRNNLIRSVSRSFWAAPAIIGFFPTRLEIAHNDIADSAYTGVSVGWCWNNYSVTPAKENVIRNNRIFDSCTKLWDGGAIYLLGRQPGTEVTGNHLGGNVDFGAIYADQGAAGLLDIADNVCEIPDEKAFFFAHSSSTRTFTVRDTWTTSLTFTNNATNVSIVGTQWFPYGEIPAAAAGIVALAGLQPEFADLLSPEALPSLPLWPAPVIYQQWASSQFGPEIAGDENLRKTIWGMQADPDGNGLKNALEFAMGLNPLVAEPGRMPSAQLAGGRLLLRYSTRGEVSGVTLIPARSADLLRWESAGVAVEMVGVEDGFELWEASISVGDAPGFLRLEARLKEP